MCVYDLKHLGDVWTFKADSSSLSINTITQYKRICFSMYLYCSMHSDGLGFLAQVLTYLSLKYSAYACHKESWVVEFYL